MRREVVIEPGTLSLEDLLRAIEAVRFEATAREITHATA